MLHFHTARQFIWSPQAAKSLAPETAVAFLVQMQLTSLHFLDDNDHIPVFHKLNSRKHSVQENCSPIFYENHQSISWRNACLGHPCDHSGGNSHPSLCIPWKVFSSWYRTCIIFFLLFTFLCAMTCPISSNPPPFNNLTFYSLRNLNALQKEKETTERSSHRERD